MPDGGSGADVETSDRQWEVDEQHLLDVLDRVVAAVERASLPYLIMGGIASASHGRPRWTHDIDLFVRPENARDVLAALREVGFRTEEFDEYWLFKAFLDDVLVDVIFRSQGDIFLDDDMLKRATTTSFRGRKITIVPPEDLLVIKALAHAEYSPRHWHDALSLIASCQLDWDYLAKRAQHGPRRVLSLLLYAQSNDLAVPSRVVQGLFASLEGS
ncbi:MAG: nucleotidyltransferase family protein [Actinomycetota bacterium]|nr:nucleotidyltransferase family protein [Actinomycetota bacterium]